MNHSGLKPRVEHYGPEGTSGSWNSWESEIKKQKLHKWINEYFKITGETLQGRHAVLTSYLSKFVS